MELLGKERNRALNSPLLIGLDVFRNCVKSIQTED
jgi:hypothetical protein